MQSCDEPPGYYSGSPSRRVLVWFQASRSQSSCEVVWELPLTVSVPALCQWGLCLCELLLCTCVRSDVLVLLLLKYMEERLLIRCDVSSTPQKQIEAVAETIPSVISED